MAEIFSSANQFNTESRIPAPPPPEIQIRTMESDIASIQEGGGEMPTAPLSGASKDKAADDSQTPGSAGDKIMFASESPLLASSKLSEGGRGTGWKIIATVIIIFVIVAIFGALGYYVIFPWLFK